MRTASPLLFLLLLPPLLSGAETGKPGPAHRTYVTQRWEGPAPVIDGKLDEAGWRQGTWSGDFRQREPIENAPATLATEIKVLYDDRNLYVAIKAHDPEVATRRKLLASPEEFAGDMVGVSLDSYHTRTTAYEFNVTMGGSKMDLVMGNKGWPDMSWKAVWDCKVGYGPDFWVAEYAIPLSQLRYIPGDSQVWGLHAWRWVDSLREETAWSFIPVDNPGFIRSFGELHGIGKLPNPRHLELVPYSVFTYRTHLPEPGNPLIVQQETKFDAGLDAKYGVTPNLTLDATVNPDFGQVEADPSEINLSTVEIFRKEQRPFFLEGKSLFDFRIEEDWAFYSRRIGAAPPLDTDDALYSLRPDTSRILGSLKLTGRTEQGLSLGVLGATTERTYASVSDGVRTTRELINPRTHYFVARGVQDLQGGEMFIGGILTGVWRDGTFGELRQLPSSANAAGLEFTKYWGGHAYVVDARILATRLLGSPRAITDKMEEWVHNFQRVDAEHLSVDPARTVLTGNAGSFRIGKENTGNWRYSGGVTWRSPGVDLNDIGYLGQADSINPNVRVDYFTAEPTPWFKRRDHSLRYRESYDYDGLLLGRSLSFVSEFVTPHNASTWTNVGLRFSRTDTRVLRGGPALRGGEYLPVNIYYTGDSSKKWQRSFGFNWGQSLRTRGRYLEIEPGFVYRPTDRLRTEFSVSLSSNRQPYQYVSDPLFGSERGWVMGRLDQRTLAGTLRLSYTFSPTLSLSYFGGPFASQGRYGDFKRVVAPYASRTEDRFRPLQLGRAGNAYSGNDQGKSVTFDNPDYTWRELKSNLVLRWEYLPGSAIYCVWSQHRSDDAEFNSFQPLEEYRQIFSAKPENIFLIKASYWFSI
ncbi:DUF5916 domain-containing protein [Nibricoccus sp. IMCC34717]|uniref:DUF5916 domain-containing protein n=1 Tax=Nibricoccus sp. IMCC34717 TaxID=3034021 RepID=UPI00384E0695